MDITIKVAALIKNNKGETLLIKEQYTEDQGYKWNLVKGTYDDPAETIEECIVREIREEVGLQNISNVSLNNVFHYGKLEDPKILFVFSVEHLGEEIVTTEHNNDDEVISEIKWFSPEELQNIKKEDCIADYVYFSINNTDRKDKIERL